MPDAVRDRVAACFETVEGYFTARDRLKAGGEAEAAVELIGALGLPRDPGTVKEVTAEVRSLLDPSTVLGRMTFEAVLRQSCRCLGG